MPIRCVPKSWEGAGAPRLIPENRPDRPVVLSRPITFIGQRRDAHLRWPASGVSSLHAVIAIDSSGAWIYDLSSRTGTHVNGQRITETRLKSEDTLKIGADRFHFVDSRSGLADQASVVPYSIEMNDGRSQAVSARFFSIGRRPGSSWRLESPDVSLTHAVICQLDGKLFLRDAGSRRGTHLNGLRVSLVQILPTDLFAIGEMKFRVSRIIQDEPQASVQDHNSKINNVHQKTPPPVGNASPRIDDLSADVLDSLFGDQEASEAEKVNEQAMNDTGSVDWGFLRSAIPTIATDDEPHEDQKSDSH